MFLFVRVVHIPLHTVLVQLIYSLSGLATSLLIRHKSCSRNPHRRHHHHHRRRRHGYGLCRLQIRSEFRSWSLPDLCTAQPLYQFFKLFLSMRRRLIVFFW